MIDDGLAYLGGKLRDLVRGLFQPFARRFEFGVEIVRSFALRGFPRVQGTDWFDGLHGLRRKDGAGQAQAAISKAIMLFFTVRSFH